MSTKTADGPVLLPETEELASGPNFAAVSTISPSGRIQTQILWVDVEDGQLLINTEVHRAKFRNISRDPRITVLIRDESDPYRYAEVRGRVGETIRGKQARAQLDKAAHKYFGKPYPEENIQSERVLLKIVPERQTYVDQR